jgi:hypothetical protein
MTTLTGDFSSSAAPSELDAWKEVHATLTEAVKRAQDAVHAQKAQRRFWMEEICANLTGEGKLKPTSVWKRPVVQKKSAVKKPTVPKTAGTKRKKKDPEAKPAKKPRKKKAANNEGESDGPKPKKIKISLKKKPAVPEAFIRQPEEELDESETYSNDSSGMQQGEYGMVPPPLPPGPQWGAAPAHNPLQMMVRFVMFYRYISSNRAIVVFLT